MAAATNGNTRAREATLAELGYMAETKFANILQVSPKTLRNRRDLPARHKLGRHCVYRVAEVQAWIARRAVAA